MSVISLHTPNPHAKRQSDCPSGGIPANRSNITLAWFLVFWDPSFCSHPKTKPHNWLLCCSIHWMPILDYCIPGCIRLQKVSISPISTQKLPKHFHAKLPQHWNSISSKLHSWFQPEFCTTFKTPNALREWSKHKHDKFTMADGCHFEKLKSHDISATVWLTVVKFGTMTCTDPLNPVCC